MLRSRFSRWWFAALVALVAFYAWSLNGRLKFGGDAVDYLRLAESLCHGTGYTIGGEFNNKWPPVTPALLAVMMLVAGSGLYLLKAGLALCAVAGLVLAWRALARPGATVEASWGVALAAVCFPFVYWMLDIASEPPFLLAVALALLLVERLGDESPVPWWFPVAAGLSLAAVVLTRTAGLAIFPAVVLHLSLRWRAATARGVIGRRGVVCLGVGLALTAAWYGYSRYRAGGSTLGVYGRTVQTDIYEPGRVRPLPVVLRERFVRNVTGYALIFATPDASARSQTSRPLGRRAWASLAVTGLMLVGIIRQLARGPRGVIEWFILCYLGLLSFHAWYDIRYLVPVLPFLFYYLARAVCWLSGRLPGWVAHAALAALLASNLAFSSVSQQARRLRSPHYTGVVQEFYEAVHWVHQRAPHDVLLCRSPNMAWYWTRQPTAGIPLVAPAAMWDQIQRVQARYLILDPDEFSGVTGKYLQPALDLHPERVQPVAAFGRTRVLQIQ